jgi:hypothetical protein
MLKDYRNAPYGVYHCEDSVVWFDRRYRPIVRVAGNAVTVVDSMEWIDHTGQTWLYDDGNAPRYNAETRRCIQNVMDAIPEMAAEVKRRYAAERKSRTIAPRRWADERPYSSVWKSTPTCTLT